MRKWLLAKGKFIFFAKSVLAYSDRSWFLKSSAVFFMAFTLIDEVFLCLFLHYDNKLEMFYGVCSSACDDPKRNFRYAKRLPVGDVNHLHIFKRHRNNCHLSQCYLYSYCSDGSSLGFCLHMYIYYNYKMSDAIANCVTHTNMCTLYNVHVSFAHTHTHTVHRSWFS